MKKPKYELFDELNTKQLLPFILITCCFVLWGFANDMTSAMTSTFSRVFNIPTTGGGMINGANSLGYLVMAIPAAIFIQKYKFKTGVLAGLALYAIGALLFLPSKAFGTIMPFLCSYFVMAMGQAILETSCIPMVYSMGSEDSGIGRLNLAQTFNALGALIGMFVVYYVVQSGISPLSNVQRAALPPAQFEIIKNHDLSVLIQPYVFISAVLILLMVAIRIQTIKLPNDNNDNKNLKQQFRDILKVKNYREAVITEFFYVGAQVCCWAYIIQYGVRIFMVEGYTEAEAEMISQKYNIAAIAMFAIFRLLCTWLMKYFDAERLLSIMAITAMTFALGTILFTDRSGLYCLIAISACMSMMFPTINGIGLRGMSKNLKLASGGFTMAVFGGAVFPALQAFIIDSQITYLGLPATNLSFIVPFVCFIIVAIFGHKAYVRQHIVHDYNK